MRNILYYIILYYIILYYIILYYIILYYIILLVLGSNHGICGWPSIMHSIKLQEGKGKRQLCTYKNPAHLPSVRSHTHTHTHTQREHFKWIRLHDYMNRVMNKNSTGKAANSAEQKYRSSANVNCRFKPHCLHSWTSKMQHRAQVPDVTTTLNLHGPPLVWTVRNLVLQKNMEMELKYKRA